MKTLKLTKAIASTLVVASILVLNPIGANAESWKYNANGQWNYEANGVNRIGWLYTQGSWFYLDDNGIMKTGWLNINGKWYYFYNSGSTSYFLGSMAYNTTINGYILGYDGAWTGNTPNTTNPNVINNTEYKTNKDTSYTFIENDENSDAKEKSTESNKSVKTVSDLERHLNNKFSSLKTPIGTLKFEFNIDENDNNMFPYDLWIQTDDTDIEDSKYDLDYFSAYDLENSIKITDHDKEKTKELLRNYQKKVADETIKYFPDKKITGGFYSGFYKYASIRVGYESIQFLSWTNYNSDAEDYSDSEVGSFEWYTDSDDYDFTE